MPFREMRSSSSHLPMIPILRTWNYLAFFALKNSISFNFEVKRHLFIFIEKFFLQTTYRFSWIIYSEREFPFFEGQRRLLRMRTVHNNESALSAKSAGNCKFSKESSVEKERKRVTMEN